MFTKVFTTDQVKCLEIPVGLAPLALIYPEAMDSLNLVFSVVPPWIPLALIWVPPKAESEIRTQGVTPESRREGRERGTGKRKAGIQVPCGGLASSWDCEGQKAYWMVH